MRDKMLGRWMVRLVVTAGVGVVALGLSPAAVHASGLPQRTLQVSAAKALTSTSASQDSPVASDPVFVVQDYTWD